MIRRVRAFAVALCLGLAGAAGAGDSQADLKRCAAEPDSLKRLTCYDGLASGASAPGNAGSDTPSTKKSEAKSDSQQCQGITKKGKQCSRKAQSGRSFCYQHGP